MDEKIKILIVEDDVFIAESLLLTLQDLGYEVDEPCLTIEEAEQALSVQNIDLILLDINFNGKDEGIDFGKRVSAVYKIPFIFLTAFSDVDTINKASEVGPSAYIIKPASSKALFAAIQTALHNFNSKIVPAQLAEHEQQEAFFIKLRNKLVKISWRDVVSIESTKNYALLKLADDKMPLVPLRGSMSHIVQLIPTHLLAGFVQLNRACYINLKYVLHIEGNSVETSVGNYRLGDIYKKQFLESLNII